MSWCKNCGKVLTNDEVGLYRKLVSRSATKYMCIPCMAKTFGCTEEELHRQIRFFRSSGCMLFSREEEKTK